MPTRKNFREKRRDRHTEALKRQEQRNARTDAQQIALARSRRGESKREIERLSRE